MASDLPPPAPGDAAGLYLDLLKRCLTNWLYPEVEAVLDPARPFDPGRRTEGLDWPPTAHTMVGRRRLDQLQRCVEAALREGVPGDLLEAGVWRGGAGILMRGVLRAYGVADRRVWLADSFAGLPPPDPARYPADAGLDLHRFPYLAVPEERVRENFRRYGLLDDRVVFLPGWFRGTLPAAPVGRLAVLRLDGDLYESTTDALVHLYPRVSAGGFVVVDDYGAVDACRQAVHDYRRAAGVADPVVAIDRSGVYWRKGG
ncbi:MAG: TylF/MycF family methyltransferase [Gemmataceae bacterium]|nr:TylF/MycF family methyltransferase [Gemmataceae bacterium]